MSYLDLAKEAAEKAGKLVMDYYGKSPSMETKSHDSDIVTEADKKSEELIIKLIKEKHPDHNILSEETGLLEGSGKVTWHIDPIDGTNNFVAGIPFFCVSIGVEEDGRLTAGVVNIPAIGETLYGSRGHGVFLNGKKVKVSEETSLRKGVFLLGQKSNMPLEVREKSVEFQQKLSDKVGSLRNFGSSAFDLAMVARGVAVGFIETGAYMWDISAGVFLVEEAGGKITRFDGSPWEPELSKVHQRLIASNKLVHDEILKKIQ